MSYTFEFYIEKSIKLINKGELEEAEEQVKNAFNIRTEAPQIHNLLGILAEYRGDRVTACKHYRAAWALDETYQPAYRNLTRLTGTSDNRFWHKFDFGLEEASETKVEKQYLKSSG